MILVQVSAIDLKVGDFVELLNTTLAVKAVKPTSAGQFVALNDLEGNLVKEIMSKDFTQFNVWHKANQIDYTNAAVALDAEYTLGLEIQDDAFVFDADGFSAVNEFEVVELKEAA
jgi:hypothetical protein